MRHQAKDLFQLQTELVEAKVDMAVVKAIDRVIDRIDGLQKDIDARFLSLREDMSAVKTKLGMTDDTRGLIRVKLVEYAYAFKTWWILLVTLGIGLSSFLLHSHLFS